MRGKREVDGCRKRHGKWWKRLWKRTRARGHISVSVRTVGYVSG
jgi:hypothetical protein